jgi:Flp pilus assembly pilin Flp
MAEYAVILSVITSAILLAIGLLTTSLSAHIVDIANRVGL